MAGQEEPDWLTRLNQQLEPLQHAGQRFARGLEAIATARDKWRPVFDAWRQFEAARDRGDFRSFQIRLRLAVWMGQQILDAKENPSHRRSRMWLAVGHLTPGQIAELLPYAMMDMPDLHIPKRKGRPRRAAAGTLAMAEQLDERIKHTGELPTTAAKRLLAKKGLRGDLKGPADHLVRVRRNRALKSR